jgi:small redox-active disulfide protein 2
MKTAKVLGTGCPKCNQLESNLRAAAAQLGSEIAIEKVTQINEIMSYRVMLTPALVIDEKVVSCGKVLPVEKIVELLQ